MACGLWGGVTVTISLIAIRFTTLNRRGALRSVPTCTGTAWHPAGNPAMLQSAPTHGCEPPQLVATSQGLRYRLLLCVLSCTTLPWFKTRPVLRYDGLRSLSLQASL